MEEVTNNLESPEITGQGEETGEVTETEQPEIQAQQEVETEEEEGKGIPDDPKLLRAKMTQTTQKLSEAEKRLAEAEEYRAKVERLLSNRK